MTYLEFHHEVKVGSIVRFNYKKAHNHGIKGVVVYIGEAINEHKAHLGDYVDYKLLLVKAIDEKHLFWNDNKGRHADHYILADWHFLELVQEES